jgi:hypothetical protein
MQVAALFVQTGGVYFGLEGVDPWDQARDARRYEVVSPVVAHPPCQRWGRYWSGGPNPNAQRRALGDDGGCFEAALAAVRRRGGVLEHPEASHAFAHFNIIKPKRTAGWQWAGHRQAGDAWVCCVEQGHYGHPARKATWLYYVGARPPFDLIWGPSQGQRLDEGFHSKAERDAARAAGVKPRKRLSTRENIATPAPFRDVLLALARHSRLT